MDLNGTISADPTTDPADPIYAFKKTLGGRYVNMGSEYRRMGGAIKPVYAVFRQAKELIRRSRVGHAKECDRKVADPGRSSVP